MVAMTVVAVSLVGILSAFQQNTRLCGVGADYATAARLAERMLTNLQVDDDLKPTTELETGDFGKPFPRFSWTREIREVELNETPFLEARLAVLFTRRGTTRELSLRTLKLKPQETEEEKKP